MNIFIISCLILFQFIIIPFIKSNSACDRDKPILKDNTCQLLFCSKDDLNSTLCEINNTIIKTQWLTQIINIGELGYRYINIVSYSNGDMVFLASSFPRSNGRIFYGINKDGRPFFNNQSTNEKEYIYKMEVNQTDNCYKYEGESSVIKLSGKNNNSGKEYLVSTSKRDSFIEIYDFDNNIIYQKDFKIFTNNWIVQSFRYCFISLISDDNIDFYYLLGFTSIGNIFMLQKHKLENISNFENEKTLNNSLFKYYCL